MSKIHLGSTGRLTTGHVLDVSVAAFNEAIQFYDKQLYTKWNPKKLNGWGCWEIRRHPETKSVVDIVQFGDATILKVDYLDYEDIHHVLDCAFLNYDALRRLKEMDIFLNENHWARNLDNLEGLQKAYEEKTKARARQERLYAIRQNKTAMKKFMNLVKDGHHPGQILSQIKWDQ